MSPWSRAVLFVSLVLVAAGVARAADSPVAERLKAAGLEYVVDEDGDYMITISYPDEGRTQLVFVGGRTEAVGALAVREVFAPATWVEGIDQGTLLELLQDSRQSKLGAWEADAEVLYFVIKLPDTVDAAQLDVAIQAAAQMADDMEIRLAGGGDSF